MSYNEEKEPMMRNRYIAALLSFVFVTGAVTSHLLTVAGYEAQRRERRLNTLPFQEPIEIQVPMYTVPPSDSMYIVPSREVDLIDWYAAFALMGLEANPASTGELAQTIAAEAWLHAKAMMEGRKWTREQFHKDAAKMKALEKELKDAREKQVPSRDRQELR